jgi:hypothetical protein
MGLTCNVHHLSLSDHKAELDLTGRFKMQEDLSGSHDLVD